MFVILNLIQNLSVTVEARSDPSRTFGMTNSHPLLSSSHMGRRITIAYPPYNLAY